MLGNWRGVTLLELHINRADARRLQPAVLVDSVETVLLGVDETRLDVSAVADEEKMVGSDGNLMTGFHRERVEER